METISATNNIHGLAVRMEIYAEEEEDRPYVAIVLEGDKLLEEIVIDTEGEAVKFLAAAGEACRKFFEMLDAKAK